MEFLCCSLILFLILFAGFFRLYSDLFGVSFGGGSQEEEQREHHDRALQDLLREPVDVASLLEESLPAGEYECFHDVTIESEDGDLLDIDHVVLSRTGLFCIRSFDRLGVVDTMSDMVEWCLEWDDQTEFLPSPRREIRETAQEVALALRLGQRSVVPLVVSCGRAVFFKAMLPGVVYAEDLPEAILRRTRQRLSDRQMARVRERLLR